MIGESLGVAKVWKPTSLHCTRWIPHIYSALETMVKNFEVLRAHFEHTAADGKSSDAMTGRAKQNAQTLKDNRQLLHIHFFLDILEALKW